MKRLILALCVVLALSLALNAATALKPTDPATVQVTVDLVLATASNSFVTWSYDANTGAGGNAPLYPPRCIRH